jgi:DNA-binding MarR family transcriptional regulator
VTTTDTARDLGALTRSMQAFGRMIAQGKMVEAVLKRAKIDLSRADLQALHALQEADGGVRPGDLADRLLVDAPTITRRVQLLEARHLVRRTTDPCDRRAQLVQLTAQGTRTLERAMAAYQVWLETVLAGWSDGDRAQFALLLRRFTDDVHAIETHGH